jgi:hypothetical protein
MAALFIGTVRRQCPKAPVLVRLTIEASKSGELPEYQKRYRSYKSQRPKVSGRKEGNRNGNGKEKRVSSAGAKGQRKDKKPSTGKKGAPKRRRKVDNTSG